MVTSTLRPIRMLSRNDGKERRVVRLIAPFRPCPVISGVGAMAKAFKREGDDGGGDARAAGGDDLRLAVHAARAEQGREILQAFELARLLHQQCKGKADRKST